MIVTYDPDKNQRNIKERNLPFDDAAFFDFATALIAKDDRKEYGEDRYLALGGWDGRVYPSPLKLQLC